MLWPDVVPFSAAMSKKEQRPFEKTKNSCIFVARMHRVPLEYIIFGTRMKEDRKRILFVLLLSLACHAHGYAQEENDSLTFAQADWNWRAVGSAQVGFAQMHLFGSVQSISIARYPSRKFKTRVIHAPGEQAAKTSQLAEQNNAALAVNASYFDMKHLTPVTFLMTKGKRYAETTPGELSRCDGIVLFRQRGKRIDIVSALPDEYESVTKGWKEAIVAGPVLMEDGKDVASDRNGSFNTNRHPRTMIGYDRKGRIYMVVVDGRAGENAAGASIPEMATIARYLGLEEAINLDGGGSSTLWNKKTGVVNHPCDNGGFDHEGERTVPNIIVAR